MRNPRISVVTPFYNSSPYLRECIESVLRQSFEDFEYILLNNCSTDNSREIAAEYAAKDGRIRVIDNDVFLTQVQNYNHALTLISNGSRYTKVVQADDWIFPRCLEEMHSLAEASPTVGLVSAYCLVGNNPYLAGIPVQQSVLPGREVWRRFLLEGIYVFGSPTSILVRSDIVRSRRPFYDEASPIEDAEACFDILASSDFAFVHQILTYTRRDNESLSTSINSFNPLLLLRLIELHKVGHECLVAREYEVCRKRITQEYLMCLCERTLRGASDRFWDFHLRGMRSIGFRPRPLEIGWSFLRVVLDLVLNPLSTAQRLLAKVGSTR
jgi:glycosyltransferase involved in cell wall biosynthesis